MIPKTIHTIKKVYATYHLKHICKHCSYHKRETRDIFHHGKCWWCENWKKGNYDEIPFWMGLKNYIRLYIFRKPIIICFHGKIYEGKI